MSQKLHQSLAIRHQSQSCAAPIAANRCFFNALFNPLDAVHYESLRFLAPHFFRWMLDFTLAPRLQFASTQK
jgi:hypothetical protein